MTSTKVYVWTDFPGYGPPCTTEECKDWCYANVGPFGDWAYKRTDNYLGYEFLFRRPEDAVAFKLKFGV
jgi:hypothetical protein